MEKWFWKVWKRWENQDLSSSLWLSNFHRFLWKSHPLPLKNYGDIFQLILAKHVSKPYLYPMSIRYTISFENPSRHPWLPIYIYSLPSINRLQNTSMKKKASFTGWHVGVLVQKRSRTVSSWRTRIWEEIEENRLHRKIVSLVSGEEEKKKHITEL